MLSTLFLLRHVISCAPTVPRKKNKQQNVPGIVVDAVALSVPCQRIALPFVVPTSNIFRPSGNTTTLLASFYFFCFLSLFPLLSCMSSSFYAPFHSTPHHPHRFTHSFLSSFLSSSLLFLWCLFFHVPLGAMYVVWFLGQGVQFSFFLLSSFLVLSDIFSHTMVWCTFAGPEYK